MTQYKVEMRDVDRRSWNDVGQFLMRMMSESLMRMMSTSLDQNDVKLFDKNGVCLRVCSDFRRMLDSFLMRTMRIMNMMIGMIETMKVKRMMNDIIMKKRRSNFQKSFQRRAKNQQ